MRAAEISEADAGGYFHISPFTSVDRKELPPAQIAKLMAALGRRFPEKKLALSCAPTKRELEKMEKLLARLPQKPWRVFAGKLKLLQLAAVIQHSAAHFCGDTGTLHLAVMTRTPTVAWFWANPGLAEWVPADGPICVVTGANGPDSPHLGAIETDALIHAAQSVLAGSTAAAYHSAQDFAS